MNPIDNVLARIQEILNRVHEIQAAQGRVSGFGPGAGASPAAGAAGQTGAASPAAQQPAAAQSASGAQSVAGVNAVEFEKLLQSAIASQGNSSAGGGAASLLSGLGSLGNVLGSGSAATGLSGTNPLAPYQQELLAAIRQLAAAKSKPASPTPPPG